MFLWGVGWLVSKLLIDKAPLEGIVFWRFLVTTLFLAPVILFTRTNIVITRNNLSQILLGTILLLLHASFFFLGLSFGKPGVGSIIFTTMVPIFTFLLVSLIMRHTFKKNELLGLFIAFIGSVMIFEVWQKDMFFSMFDSGNVFFLIAAFSWSCVILVSQKAYKNISPLGLNFYFSLFGSLLIFMFLPNETIFGDYLKSADFWMEMLFLGLLANTVATTIFFYASGIIGSHKSSTFIYLVPVFAMLSSWIMIDETPKAIVIAGALVTVFATLQINKKSN